MSRKPQKRWRSGRNNKNRSADRESFPSVPPALHRPPRTDMEAHVVHLDAAMYPAVETVLTAMRFEIEKKNSLEELHLMMTRTHLLLAMCSTHRSIRKLVTGSEEDEWELSVDALPLTRVQLERCFLCLLLADNPVRWHKRYCKNAWKAFAEKFFRDRAALGSFPQFQDYFGSSGTGIQALRAFARQMYVWEDELQTFRAELLGEEMDARWEKRYIADMPTPGRAVGLLRDPARKKLASLLYPYYDTLSHFSHGGLVGAMEAAILRPDATAAGENFDRRAFWTSSVLEMTLPPSYVAILAAATLFSTDLPEADDVRHVLAAAWQPYHSDGSALGVAVWDSYAADALGAAQAT